VFLQPGLAARPVCLRIR